MARSLHDQDLHTTAHATHDGEPVHHAELHELSEENWKEPKNLDAPPAREGFRQRWIRVSLRETKDALNFNNKMREGWRPRTLDTVPEPLRAKFPVMKDPNIGDVIYVGGCILCEMPEKLAASRDRQVRMKIERQNKAVLTDTDQVSRKHMARGGTPLIREERETVSNRAPVIQTD